MNVDPVGNPKSCLTYHSKNARFTRKMRLNLAPVPTPTNPTRPPIASPDPSPHFHPDPTRTLPQVSGSST